MRTFLLAFMALLLALFATHVQAQQAQAVTVAACGTPPNTPVVGNAYTVTMDTTGKLCTSGSGGGGGATATIVPTGQAANGITPVPSTATESCHVLKASAGNLYDVSATLPSAGWVMVFNAAAAPSNGAVTPIAWAQSYTPGTVLISYGIIPGVFSAGITVCTSSTGPLSLTLLAGSVFSGRVE